MSQTPPPNSPPDPRRDFAQSLTRLFLRALVVMAAFLLVWQFLRPAPDSYRDVLARVLPSVAGIYGSSPGPERSDSIGAGVVVDERHILTNYHLVANMSEIEADIGGEVRSAQLTGVDPEIDIALLRVPGAKMHPASFAESGLVQQGDIVFAIGNPFGLSQSASMGIVSAVGRNLAGTPHREYFIQTDAAINPGNSGGALVNIDGELIGINSALFSDHNSNGNGGPHGIGFAVPADVVRRSLRDFLPQPPADNPLGAEVRPMSERMHREILDFTPEVTPVMVISRVWLGTPAEKMDLQPGDIVLEINGEPARDLSETGALPLSLQTMVVLRAGQHRLLQLTNEEHDS